MSFKYQKRAVRAHHTRLCAERGPAAEIALGHNLKEKTTSSQSKIKHI